MLFLLSILFPILFLGVVIEGRYVLKLWGYSALWSDLVGGLSSAAILGFYFYSGVSLNSLETPNARRFFIVHVLQSSFNLTAICLVCVLLIFGFTFLGKNSESLSFVADSDIEFDVWEKKGGKLRLLGTSSKATPLMKRFLAGKHQFQFQVPDHCNLEQDIWTYKSGFSGPVRRYIVKLRVNADFILRDFMTLPDEFFGYPQGFQPPKRLTQQSSLNLILSLFSSSPIPLWIQSLNLQIIEVTELKLSTFPLDGLGADGTAPIVGYIELKPKIGLYRAKTRTKSKVGSGLDPDDYSLQIFSPRGHQYKAKLELEWADMKYQTREGRHVFDNQIHLEFPEILDWEYLVRGGKMFKILHDETFYAIWPRILEECPGATYSALIASSEYRMDEEMTAKMANVFFATDRTKKRLMEIFPSETGRLRNFILVDSSTLILQDVDRSDRPDLAEIITDTGRIAAVELVFDEIIRKEKH